MPEMHLSLWASSEFSSLFEMSDRSLKLSGKLSLLVRIWEEERRETRKGQCEIMNEQRECIE